MSILGSGSVHVAQRYAKVAMQLKLLSSNSKWYSCVAQVW